MVCCVRCIIVYHCTYIMVYAKSYVYTIYRENGTQWYTEYEKDHIFITFIGVYYRKTMVHGLKTMNIDNDKIESLTNLYHSYSQWCVEKNKHKKTLREFSDDLVTRGYKRIKTKKGTMFIGIEIK